MSDICEVLLFVMIVLCTIIVHCIMYTIFNSNSLDCVNSVCTMIYRINITASHLPRHRCSVRLWNCMWTIVVRTLYVLRRTLYAVCRTMLIVIILHYIINNLEFTPQNMLLITIYRVPCKLIIYTIYIQAIAIPKAIECRLRKVFILEI